VRREGEEVIGGYKRKKGGKGYTVVWDSEEECERGEVRKLEVDNGGGEKGEPQEQDKREDAEL